MHSAYVLAAMVIMAYSHVDNLRSFYFLSTGSRHHSSLCVAVKRTGLSVQGHVITSSGAHCAPFSLIWGKVWRCLHSDS